jgi:hypothetical protein
MGTNGSIKQKGIMEPPTIAREHSKIKNKSGIDTGQVMEQTTPEKVHATLETFEGRGKGWPKDKK